MYVLPSCARLKKLQETLVAVQQLESNMSALRRWLAYIEHELSSPIVFHHPDMPEIQAKLQRHQVNHSDIRPIDTPHIRLIIDNHHDLVLGHKPSQAQDNLFQLAYLPTLLHSVESFHI